MEKIMGRGAGVPLPSWPWDLGSVVVRSRQ